MLPKRRFWKDEQKIYLYALQTNILERGTKYEMRGFEVLLKCVITRFALRTIELSIRKSAFHLLFLFPKSSFGRHEVCKMLQRWWHAMLCYDIFVTSWQDVTKDDGIAMRCVVSACFTRHIDRKTDGTRCSKACRCCYGTHIRVCSKSNWSRVYIDR